MQKGLTVDTVIHTLKNAIRWKNNDTIKANKIALNLFLDFVKLRFLPKNDISAKTFADFLANSNDAKIEGKLETWVEIAFGENEGMLKDLQEKVTNVEAFYKKNLLGEKEESLKENVEESETKPETEVLEKQEGEVTEPEHEEEEDDHEDDKVESLSSAERPIIVPWDFTKVAAFALEHAVKFAKKTGEQIYMLHITKTDKEIEKATKEMQKVADDTFKKSKVKPQVMVQTGNILKTITEIANEQHAKFVIMGTHGVKGMQKFTGSLALKVIAGTNTPFVVVQDSPKAETIRTVVFPVDYKKENKQKLKQANLLAKYYKVKYIITIPEKTSSDQTKKHTLASNLRFVKTYFAQHNIEYEVVKVEKTDSFMDATLKYAAEHTPDMIMVMTTKNINIQDYVLGADEQKIITNKTKIPVMCVNPMKVKYSVMSVHGVA